MVLRPALFCMVAAVFFSPLFFAFSFLWVRCLCGECDGGRGADMMDGTGGHGQAREGAQGRLGWGGAQCRAPCLRGTCEAWRGLGW